MSNGFKKADLAVIKALLEGTSEEECPVCFGPCKNVATMPCGGFICVNCYETYLIHGKCPCEGCTIETPIYSPPVMNNNHDKCKVERNKIIDPKYICACCNEEHDYVPLVKGENVKTISEGINRLKELNFEKYFIMNENEEKSSISELNEEHKKMSEKHESMKMEKEEAEKKLEDAKNMEKERNDELTNLDAKIAERDAEIEQINKELEEKTSQNEETKQKIEASNKRLDEYKEEKRKLEENTAKYEREINEIEQLKNKTREELEKEEKEILENEKRLKELNKKNFVEDDDDDDDNDDSNTIEKGKKCSFNRTLHINIDFEPERSREQQKKAAEGNVSYMGLWWQGAKNAYQNAIDYLPGCIKTKEMHDIEEFEMRERLGLWGSGNPVFKAVLKSKNENYALKKIKFRENPAPILSASTWTSAKPTDEEKCKYSIDALSDEDLTRFTEPYILTSIHEGNEGLSELIKPEFYVRDKKSSGTLFYVATPYYDIDLEYAITNKIVKLSQLRDIAKQLFMGISYLHSLNIVHRDICTSSILIRKPVSQLEKNRCPITIAGMGHATLTNCARNSYPGFKLSRFHPPECFISKELDDDESFWMKVDIWSAGCVLAEIALGEKLFSTHELSEIGSDSVSERVNEAVNKAVREMKREDVELMDCIRNTVVFNPRGRIDSIRALNDLGITPNVFNSEQTVVLENDNIRTFILKTCPYISI